MTLLVSGGDSGARTRSLRLAKPALSQLSYIPETKLGAASRPSGVVGLGGLEPPTSRLSGVRSNQLSYRPTPRGDAEEIEPAETVVAPTKPPSPRTRQGPSLSELRPHESSPTGKPVRLGSKPQAPEEEEQRTDWKAREVDLGFRRSALRLTDGSP